MNEELISDRDAAAWASGLKEDGHGCSDDTFCERLSLSQEPAALVHVQPLLLLVRAPCGSHSCLCASSGVPGGPPGLCINEPHFLTGRLIARQVSGREMGIGPCNNSDLPL